MAAIALWIVPVDPLRPLVGLPGVAAGVTQVRVAVDQMLAHRILRRRSAEVSAESALRGARAVARMGGADVRLVELRAGSAADPAVLGALRVYAEIGPLAGTWPRAPRQVLARLHALAARGLVADEALGRPVTGADRLDVLSEVLSATRAPALVVAAVTLGEILALDAFAPCSATVGWAAVRLCLVDRGLDPKSLAIPEVAALELAAPLDGYRAGDVAEWVGYLAQAIVGGTRETLALCEALERG
jgi:hypothetical protein